MPSPLELLALMEEDERNEYVKSLKKEEIIDRMNSWEFTARDEQLPPLSNDWNIWLLLAGRGFG